MEDDIREGLAKAHVFTGVQASNQLLAGESSPDNAIFEKTGSIEPPYSPETLCRLFEHSSALRQNIDAYCVNIDGNGHRFEPIIDLEADNVVEIVRDAMFFDRIAEIDNPLDATLPTDEEVEERIDAMRIEMRIEEQKLRRFFDFISVDEPFVAIRKKMRQDKELLGNGFWEVLRDGTGQPVQFNYIPAFTVRLMRQAPTAVNVTVRVKQSPLTITDQPMTKFFRRFVQVHDGSLVYFKEFGDPRTMSSRTGRYYDDPKKLAAEESGALPATEIIHFAVHSPRSPYGVPRWIGTMLAVLGSRQAEEVNFLYFDNKSVPPLAILVSGGRLSKESKSKIEDFIKNRIHGRENFHAALIIEALPAGSQALDAANAKMKIELVPLTMAQHNDALFQNYDERNIDKIGMSFRLPRMLRGDIRDFNRSTSESALEFAEMQVFAPERTDFDFVMNRKILPELGVKYFTFASNSPNIGNPIDLSAMISQLVGASILTPEEARELAKGVFNRDFKRIEEIWTQIPPDLLKSGIVPDGEASFLSDDGGDSSTVASQAQEGGTEGDDGSDTATDKEGRQRIGRRYRGSVGKRDMRKLASDLIRFRSMLDVEAERVRASEIAQERADLNGERRVIKLSAQEFAELVGNQDVAD